MNDPSAAPRRELSLVDAVSIIVGIVIGSGIYMSPPIVAGNVPSTGAMLGVWIAGGLFALVGSLCYAELATTYPAEGGDYVYLTRAYGRNTGFLFAWLQLGVVRPGSIGLIALVFAPYATTLWSLGEYSQPIYAIGSVLLLAAVNILGVSVGKWTQNLLTAAKLLGLLIILAAALWTAAPVAEAADARTAASPGTAHDNLPLAMILVMFAYSGWNEMAFVAAEVRDPQRNIFRALVLGTATILGVYLLANAAFVHVLGFEGVRQSRAVAADVAQAAFGAAGQRFTSALICVSALGAIAGMTFTSARVYYAMGREHRLFARLGSWSPTFGTPVVALLLEAAITALTLVVFSVLPRGDSSTFERLVTFTAPPFWFFLALSGFSLLVLRWRDPAQPRPVRVPGYPVLPAVFVLGSLAMVYASLDYAVRNRSWEALWPLGLLAVGLVLCGVEGMHKAKGRKVEKAGDCPFDP